LKWHIRNTNIPRQEEIKEELTTRQLHLLWVIAQIADLQSYTTGYVLNAAITGASLLLKRKRQPDFF
jgi:hypothetical protein